MKSVSVILGCFLILVLWCGPGDAFLEISRVMMKQEDYFCFKVGDRISTGIEPELEPGMMLILDVKYPMSIAEAGQTFIFGDQLYPGLHNVSYKYKITNMTHDLQIWLDGVATKFLKSEVPRWYSVSSFHEVALLLQGDISVVECSDESNETKLVPPSEKEEEEDKYDHFFIEYSKQNVSKFSTKKNIDDAKTDLETEPKSDDKVFDESILNVDGKDKVLNNTSSKETYTRPTTTTITSSNITTTITTTTDPELPQLPLITETHQFPSPNPNPTDLPIPVPIPTIDSNPTDLPIPVPIPTIDSNPKNISNQEQHHIQNLLKCLPGSCESSIIHDYSLGYILLGVLGGLVFIAIVISLVFYRKKKKLVAVVRAQPKHRLREKLYQDALEEGESQLMLKGISHSNYEEIL